MKIEFLRNKNEEEIRTLFCGFSQRYLKDIHYFKKTTDKFGLISPQSAMDLSLLLKKWTACRPSSVNTDILPLLKELEADLTTISDLDLRNIRGASPNEKEALTRIWSKLINGLCVPKKLSGVAPSKAILILTNGRLGPALDSHARAVLGLPEIVSVVEYFTIMYAISEDIAAFEEAHPPILIETLISEEWQPVFVGRAYDMAVGPRE